MLKKIKAFFHDDVGRLVLIAVVLHAFTYFGTRLFTSGWYHYDMATILDNFIPVVPWTVVIYLGCYIFWAANFSTLDRMSFHIVVSGLLH